MILGNTYITLVESYFDFLINEFDFKISEEKIKGNVFYDVKYKDKTRIISISYENIEDYLLVIIFLLQNGELPDYDDKTKTLHLNKLNAEVLSRIDKSVVSLNNQHFAKFNTKDEFERKLLKSAKELRLCLKYFGGFAI